MDLLIIFLGTFFKVFIKMSARITKHLTQLGLGGRGDIEVCNPFLTRTYALDFF